MKHEHKQRKHSPNLRKYPRGICLMGAKLKVDGRAVPCATKNLTPEGVFVKTSEALAIGDTIALSFTLPGIVGALQVSGKVVRSHGDGVGIKFDIALQNLLKQV